MTDEEKFIQKEIDTWGLDYIDELFMKGYRPMFVDGLGKWMWLLPSQQLQTANR
jgi:hypothetical protein